MNYNRFTSIESSDATLSEAPQPEQEYVGSEVKEVLDNLGIDDLIEKIEVGINSGEQIEEVVTQGKERLKILRHMMRQLDKAQELGSQAVNQAYQEVEGQYREVLGKTAEAQSAQDLRDALSDTEGALFEKIVTYHARQGDVEETKQDYAEKLTDTTQEETPEENQEQQEKGWFGKMTERVKEKGGKLWNKAREFWNKDTDDKGNKLTWYQKAGRKMVIGGGVGVAAGLLGATGIAGAGGLAAGLTGGLKLGVTAIAAQTGYEKALNKIRQGDEQKLVSQVHEAYQNPDTYQDLGKTQEMLHNLQVLAGLTGEEKYMDQMNEVRDKVSQVWGQHTVAQERQKNETSEDQEEQGESEFQSLSVKDIHKALDRREYQQSLNQDKKQRERQQKTKAFATGATVGAGTHFLFGQIGGEVVEAVGDGANAASEAVTDQTVTENLADIGESVKEFELIPGANAATIPEAELTSEEVSDNFTNVETENYTIDETKGGVKFQAEDFSEVSSPYDFDTESITVDQEPEPEPGSEPEPKPGSEPELKPEPEPEPEPEPNPEVYQLEPGDTLWGIVEQSLDNIDADDIDDGKIAELTEEFMMDDSDGGGKEQMYELLRQTQDGQNFLERIGIDSSEEWVSEAKPEEVWEAARYLAPGEFEGVDSYMKDALNIEGNNTGEDGILSKENNTGEDEISREKNPGNQEGDGTQRNSNNGKPNTLEETGTEEENNTFELTDLWLNQEDKILENIDEIKSSLEVKEILEIFNVDTDGMNEKEMNDLLSQIQEMVNDPEAYYNDEKDFPWGVLGSGLIAGGTIAGIGAHLITKNLEKRKHQPRVVENLDDIHNYIEELVDSGDIPVDQISRGNKKTIINEIKKDFLTEDSTGQEQIFQMMFGNDKDDAAKGVVKGIVEGIVEPHLTPDQKIYLYPDGNNEADLEYWKTLDKNTKWAIIEAVQQQNRVSPGKIVYHTDAFGEDRIRKKVEEINRRLGEISVTSTTPTTPTSERGGTNSKLYDGLTEDEEKLLDKLLRAAPDSLSGMTLPQLAIIELSDEVSSTTSTVALDAPDTFNADVVTIINGEDSSKTISDMREAVNYAKGKLPISGDGLSDHEVLSTFFAFKVLEKTSSSSTDYSTYSPGKLIVSALALKS